MSESGRRANLWGGMISCHVSVCKIVLQESVAEHVGSSLTLC